MQTVTDINSHPIAGSRTCNALLTVTDDDRNLEPSYITRNGDILEPNLAGARELETDQDRNNRIYDAKWDCGVCVRCKRKLGSRETVWRRLAVCKFSRGQESYHVAPFCRKCPSKYSDYLPEQPCKHCGRGVVNLRNNWQYYREHTFCSQRCDYEYRKTMNKQSRQLPQFVCRVCDKPFKPSRRDALHCSSACRQRDYRNRQREVSKKQT